MAVCFSAAKPYVLPSRQSLPEARAANHSLHTVPAHVPLPAEMSATLLFGYVPLCFLCACHSAFCQSSAKKRSGVRATAFCESSAKKLVKAVPKNASLPPPTRKRTPGGSVLVAVRPGSRFPGSTAFTKSSGMCEKRVGKHCFHKKQWHGLEKNVARGTRRQQVE